MKHHKHIIRPLTALLSALPLALSAQMAINDGTAGAPGAPPVNPDQAILELNSTTRGLLVPRMTAAQRDNIGGGAAPNGLLVFVTSPPAEVGYWYRDNLIVPNAWVPFVEGSGWDVPGNAGIVAGDYIGTTDNQPMVFRTAGTERMRLTNTTGRLGVGTDIPAERVEVDGGWRITGPSATNNAGAIRFNPATGAHEGNIGGTVNDWYQLENVWQENTAAPWQFITGGCNPAPNGWVQFGNGALINGLTTFTPYSLFWEDSRKQYLFLASELAAAQVCTTDPFTSVAFNATANSTMPTACAAGNGPFHVRLPEIKMKNTTTTAMNTFDLTGLELLWNPPGVNIVNGWNTHTFTTPNFFWNGTANMILEFCFDNLCWGTNVGVRSDNVGFTATYGMYCDACGGNGFTFPCGPLGGFPPLPDYGAVGGCGLTPTSSLVTCDGTFQYTGAQAPSTQRPQVRFGITVGGLTITILNDDYLWSDLGVVIGDEAYSTGGAFPNNHFKGPGTLAAQWGVYANNVRLSDHVFDIHYDGQPRPEDAEKAEGYTHLSIPEMVNYVERERHLPTIPGRKAWETEGPFSVDRLTNSLWITVEQQALYIKELNERLELMEQHLVQKRLRELERERNR